MRSPDSCSVIATATPTADAAESSMDDNASDNRHLSPKSTSLTTATHHTTGPFFTEEGNGIDGDSNFQDRGDPKIWASFTENFRQVQSVLDRNRVLIQQVNENHQSKIHDNLVKNVALIQEINGNISKVVSLYSNLSNDFSGVFHQRGAAGDGKGNSAIKQ